METAVKEVQFSSVQWLRRVQLCDPMDCNTPGPPVHHQLLGFTQTHVHWSIICSMCSLLGILRLAVLNLINKLFILPFISQIQIIINEEHKIPQLDSDFSSIYDLFPTTPRKIRLFLPEFSLATIYSFISQSMKIIKKMNKNLKNILNSTWHGSNFRFTWSSNFFKEYRRKINYKSNNKRKLELFKGDETDLQII